MKPSVNERENLTRRLRLAREKSSITISHLAKIAHVDPGQTSRILAGQFKTLSGNVVQICSALGIDPHTITDETTTPEEARSLKGRARLEAAVRRAWDETAGDAEVLVRVMDAVAKVRGR